MEGERMLGGCFEFLGGAMGDWLCFGWWKSKNQSDESAKQQETPSQVSDDEGGEKPIIFTYHELRIATKDFHNDEILGIGGSGIVYKGLLSTGEIVAVKKFKRSVSNFEKQFKVEIEMLSELRHPNIVKLIGYCYEGFHPLVVLEYMPKGSLDQNLHDLEPGQEPLDWTTRMKIAAGVARGLEYMHNEVNPPVIFRDLKSANILLDEEFHPKLCDFGFAKEGPVGDASHVIAPFVVTRGYYAPEYFESWRLSPMCDVYSFGAVLLEIISGKRAYDDSRGLGKASIVQWATQLMKDVRIFVEFEDSKVKGNLNYSMLILWMAVQLALTCVNEDPKSRPTMREVATAMESLVSGNPDFAIMQCGERLILSLNSVRSPKSLGKLPLVSSPPSSPRETPLSPREPPLSPNVSPLRRVVSPKMSPNSPRKSPKSPKMSGLRHEESSKGPENPPSTPENSPKKLEQETERELVLQEAKEWGKEWCEKIHMGEGSSSSS